ncbi:hypothetical protein Bbelb_317970, partial [Branchiostoma belcheri]
MLPLITLILLLLGIDVPDANGVVVNGNVGETYQNDKHAKAFAMYIHESMFATVKSAVDDTEFFSILSDGSTDVQEEIVYVKVLENFRPVIKFVALKPLQKADAESITRELVEVMEQDLGQADLRDKLCAAFVDGANVMLGHVSGVVTRLKDESSGQHVLGIHCSGHKLELAYKNTLNDVAYFRNVTDTLHNLYKFYQSAQPEMEEGGDDGICITTDARHAHRKNSYRSDILALGYKQCARCDAARDYLRAMALTTRAHDGSTQTFDRNLKMGNSEGKMAKKNAEAVIRSSGLPIEDLCSDNDGGKNTKDTRRQASHYVGNYIAKTCSNALHKARKRHPDNDEAFVEKLKQLRSTLVPTPSTYHAELPPATPNPTAGPEDATSVAILQLLDPAVLQRYQPLSVEADDNCFYRAISRVLYGHDLAHPFLRLLTTMEIAEHRSFYDREAEDAIDLIEDEMLRDEDYSAVLRHAVHVRLGRYARFHYMLAMSSVLGTPFESYCPPTGHEHAFSAHLTRDVRGRNNIPSSLLEVSGYTLYRRDRDRHGGGTGVYVKRTIPSEHRPDLEHTDLEVCCVEVKPEKARKTLLACIYRPPNSGCAWRNAAESFVHDLSATAEKENTDVMIMGDFNVDLSKSTPVTTPLEFLMSLYQLVPLITQPTRITEASATCIDNIFVSNPDRHRSSLSVAWGASDHNLILTCAKAGVEVGRARSREYRNYKNYSQQSFIDSLKAVHWETVLDCINVSEAWAAFKDIFLSVAEAHAPITRKQVKEKGRPAPWLTDRVKNLMGQRDAARRKAIKTKDTKDWECYRSLRNQTTAMIKKAKKTHFESAITDAAEDPSLMWKIINNFTGKTASKGQVQKIRRSDESCTSEPAEMAEEFNNYFSSCAADLARDIPVSEEDPLRHVPESTSTFRLRPVEEIEVLNELLRLKPKKATGVDKIPSRLLKDSAPIIVKPLAHIFNLSISSGEVPDDWKLAKVSPIYKSGNKDSVSNYRPVSVLNVASKVMEKMVHNQVSHFVNSTGQLTAHQSGFRKHHSTGSAVQKVVEDIQSAQNNQKVTVALFLDLRKAFDTVNHQILLGKLQKMGFDNGATNWFRVRTRTAMKQLLSFDPYMLDTPKANLETFKGKILYELGLSESKDVVVIRMDTISSESINNMERRMRDAMKDTGKVILVDETYQLGSKTSSSIRIMAGYLQQIEDKIFSLNEGFRGWFPDTVHFLPLTVQQLTDILEQKIKLSGYTISDYSREEMETAIGNIPIEVRSRHNARLVNQLIVKANTGQHETTLTRPSTLLTHLQADNVLLKRGAEGHLAIKLIDFGSACYECYPCTFDVREEMSSHIAPETSSTPQKHYRTRAPITPNIRLKDGWEAFQRDMAILAFFERPISMCVLSGWMGGLPERHGHPGLLRATHQYVCLVRMDGRPSRETWPSWPSSSDPSVCVSWQDGWEEFRRDMSILSFFEKFFDDPLRGGVARIMYDAYVILMNQCAVLASLRHTAKRARIDLSARAAGAPRLGEQPACEANAPLRKTKYRQFWATTENRRDDRYLQGTHIGR